MAVVGSYIILPYISAQSKTDHVRAFVRLLAARLRMLLTGCLWALRLGVRAQRE